MGAVTATATLLSECTGLSVVHGSGPSRVEALREADFGISDGEKVALRGPSGSGKTTLLHALGGLLTPSAGTVSWLGQPLSTLDAAARGRVRATGIAYIFQSANLLLHLTAFENVAFAIACRGGDDPADPAELLTLVGLESKLDALPAELSGGEAQRVAIARALGQRPRLLLADEPTGHLDSDTGNRVLDLIDALQEEFGFALLTATHDVDVAGRHGRLVDLADGRIVGEQVTG